MSHIKSERKWLLSKLPAFEPLPGKTAAKFDTQHIMQGYLPDGAWVCQIISLDMPIRKENDPMRGPEVIFTYTAKIGKNQARIEGERQLPVEEFEELWSKVQKKVNKIRFRVYDVLTWEIDVFLDKVLVLAELKEVPEGYTPIIPEWLQPYIVRDMTDNPKFTDEELALQYEL